MDIQNILFILAFVLVIAYSIRRLIKMKNEVLIYTRLWDLNRMLYMFIFVFSILVLFFFHDTMELIRNILMTITIGCFTFLREGMTEEGIFNASGMIVYDDIATYDIQKEKKKVLFVAQYKNRINKKTGKADQFQYEFALEDYEKLEELMSKKLPKKLRRMKRN